MVRWSGELQVNVSGMSGERQISIWAWHWWTWNLFSYRSGEADIPLQPRQPRPGQCLHQEPRGHSDQVRGATVKFHWEFIVKINSGEIKRFPSSGLLPTPGESWDFAWVSAWSRYKYSPPLKKSVFPLTIWAQVFEVLHYLGSCLLKLVKAKVVRSGQKQRRVTSSSSKYETSARDEDPFLASIKRTNTINNIRIQDTTAGDGKGWWQSWEYSEECVNISEYEPCISDKSTSRGVPEGMESVDLSNAQSDDKSRDTFQRKLSTPQINGHTKDFKSFQVKYTDSKQPNRLEIVYYCSSSKTWVFF